MAFTSVGKKTNVFNSLGFSSRAASLELRGREPNIYRPELSFMEHLCYLHYFHILTLSYINTSSYSNYFYKINFSLLSIYLINICCMCRRDRKCILHPKCWILEKAKDSREAKNREEGRQLMVKCVLSGPGR